MSQSPPRWPRAVLFDLDGTLVDSAPDIAEALSAAMAVVDGPRYEASSAIALIGGGAEAALARASAAAGIAPTEAQRARMLAAFMTTYRTASARGRGLYPGAAELLDRLSVRAIGLGVVTNKAEEVAEIALAALGIRGRFGAVVGASPRLAKKPAAAMVHAALDQLRVAPDQAALIGDSAADVGAARAAGIPVIAVSFGYAHGPVEALGADLIVAHLGELDAALATLAKRRA